MSEQRNIRITISALLHAVLYEKTPPTIVRDLGYACATVYCIKTQIDVGKDPHPPPAKGESLRGSKLKPRRPDQVPL